MIALNWDKIKEFIKLIRPSLLQRKEGELSLLASLAYPHLKEYEKKLGEDFPQAMALSLIHMEAYVEQISLEGKDNQQVYKIKQGNSSVSFYPEISFNRPLVTSNQFWSSTLSGALLRELLWAHGISLSPEKEGERV